MLPSLAVFGNNFLFMASVTCLWTCLAMLCAGLGSGCEKVKIEIASLLKGVILTGVQISILTGF